MLKGYSTGEDSATITEVILIHNDVRSEYGDDDAYKWIGEY